MGSVYIDQKQDNFDVINPRIDTIYLYENAVRVSYGSCRSLRFAYTIAEDYSNQGVIPRCVERALFGPKQGIPFDRLSSSSVKLSVSFIRLRSYLFQD